MTNAKVTSRGGNQYDVTINGETHAIDLDGFNIMSDEALNRLEELKLDQDDMLSPTHAQDAEQDIFFQAAVDYAANYSGFDVEQYITDNQ